MAEQYLLDKFVGKDIWVKAKIDKLVCWIQFRQKYPSYGYDCRIITDDELNSNSKYWLDLFEITHAHHPLASEGIELITPVETMTSAELWSNSSEAYMNYLATPDILRRVCGKDLWVKAYTADGYGNGFSKYIKVVDITATKVIGHEVLAEILDDPAYIMDIGEVIWDIAHMDDNYTYNLDEVAIFDNPTEYLSTDELIDVITDIYGQDIWEAQ